MVADCARDSIEGMGRVTGEAAMGAGVVDRDYELLVAQVLERLFPEAEDRARAVEILSQYQGREPWRVYLGILKLSNGDLAALRKFTEVAIWDWRELLCAAEYPLTSRRWGLRERDPIKYERLREKEREEYDTWLRTVLAT